MAKYSCGICQAEFDSLFDLDRHLAKEHGF